MSRIVSSYYQNIWKPFLWLILITFGIYPIIELLINDTTFNIIFKHIYPHVITTKDATSCNVFNKWLEYSLSIVPFDPFKNKLDYSNGQHFRMLIAQLFSGYAIIHFIKTANFKFKK